MGDAAPRLKIAGLKSELAGPFDLEVAAGECVGITGASGSGQEPVPAHDLRTSMLNQGEVWLDGAARSDMAAPAWRRQVMYVPAESGWWTDVIADHFPKPLLGAAYNMAQRLGLPAGIVDGPVSRLSTGERQRLSMIRALVMASPVLLLDEPTSALDVVDGAAQVEAILTERLAERPRPGAGHPRPGPGGTHGSPALCDGARRASGGRAVNTISLTPWDLAIASSLIVFDAILSLVFRLRLHRQLIVASVRLVVQLVAIGFVLKFVFALHNPAVTLLLIVIMVLMAARETAARTERRFKGQTGLAIGAASVASATLITAIFALTTALRPHPWYDARYAVPLAGILLGNILNATSLSLDSVLGSMALQKAAVEARLTLGHTYWQAATRRSCATRSAAGWCR